METNPVLLKIENQVSYQVDLDNIVSQTTWPSYLIDLPCFEELSYIRHPFPINLETIMTLEQITPKSVEMQPEFLNLQAPNPLEVHFYEQDYGLASFVTLNECSTESMLH